MKVIDLIQISLNEDIGDGDHTSLATIPHNAQGKAALFAKEEGIICGIDIAKQVFHSIDKEIVFTPFFSDGDSISIGDLIFQVEGNSIHLLTAERTALNFMQRMSGIATKTAEYLTLVSSTDVKLLDTRKTTPAMRELEKYAVKTGGGTNHRFGLYDMVMIKDNHVDFAGGIKNAIKACHQYLDSKKKDLKIEIEVRDFEELQQVLDFGGVHRIMLDNFSVADLKKAIELIDGKYETEASGGITLETILPYAQTGVEFISVGALTHQISSLDLSLKAI